MRVEVGQLDVEGFEGVALRPAQLCPICGTASSTGRPCRTIHPDAPVGVLLRRCRSCRHMWIDPLPTQGFLTHLYSSGSRSVLGVGWRTGPRSLSWPEALVASTARGSGAYFELGVGQGILYETMRARGWECQGVEPGASHDAPPGVVPSVDDLAPGQRFQVLVANDVLEHIADPLEALVGLRTMTAVDGELFGSFPRGTSLRGRLQGPRWRMVRPFGHVHFFSRTSAEKVLEAAGFRLVTWRTSDLATEGPATVRSHVARLVEQVGLGDQAWFHAVQVESRS